MLCRERLAGGGGRGWVWLRDVEGPLSDGAGALPSADLLEVVVGVRQVRIHRVYELVELGVRRGLAVHDEAVERQHVSPTR